MRRARSIPLTITDFSVMLGYEPADLDAAPDDMKPRIGEKLAASPAGSRLFLRPDGHYAILEPPIRGICPEYEFYE